MCSNPSSMVQTTFSGQVSLSLISKYTLYYFFLTMLYILDQYRKKRICEYYQQRNKVSIDLVLISTCTMIA